MTSRFAEMLHFAAMYRWRRFQELPADERREWVASVNPVLTDLQILDPEGELETLATPDGWTPQAPGEETE